MYFWRSSKTIHEENKRENEEREEATDRQSADSLLRVQLIIFNIFNN